MRRVALVLCLLLVTAGAVPIGAALSVAPAVTLVPVPGVFQMPVAMTQHPDSDDLYIVEKTGRVRAVRDGLLYDPEPVIDLSDEVSGGLEQGLLGLAFSPDGEHAYLSLTSTGGTSRLLEFAFADGTFDPDSRREVLAVEQLQANHNGGTIEFGPDGYLYYAIGDGGGAGDPGYHGQRLETLLGAMLRIDPRGSGTEPYAMPEDNPFVEGPEDARPEIWAYGLRNPWKFSFDRETGDLWIADVGQSLWEEINLQRADSPGGENYGWNHMEGFVPYPGRPQGAEEPEDHTPPIYAYPNQGSMACSITGGYVYRGSAEWLQGAYVFSDWCEGVIRSIREVDGEVVEESVLASVVPLITAFGEDHDGELYGLSLGGAVFRIVPSPVG